jgi:glycerol transport system ATP-binding protein
MDLILDDVQLIHRGEFWLRDISLEIAGGMTVVIGPTGAGKTTLLRVVAGLVRPDSGRILVNGEDVTGFSVRRRSVAFVYQQFVNYPSLTVYENLASPLRFAGASRTAVDDRVREVAGLMGIGHLLDRRPAELSGGQQQRTAIGRALARPADVLLLDEPLGNLDYKLREQLRDEFAEMFRDAGRVVLWSTSEPEEALAFAAPAVVLGEGRVVHAGDVGELYRHPPMLAVAAALSDPPLNRLPGVAGEGRITCLGASFAAPGARGAARPVTLGVRPHQVAIERRGPDDLELPAEVRLAEVTGSATFLHLRVAAGEDGAAGDVAGADDVGGVDGGTHLVAELPGTRRFTPGEPARAYVDPSDVYVFDRVTGRVLAEDATEVETGVDGGG